MSAILALSLWLYIRNRAWAAGMAASLGVVVVKVLAVLLVPALFFFLNRRSAVFLAGVTVPPAIISAAYYSSESLYGFHLQNNLQTAPPAGLPFFITGIVHFAGAAVPPMAFDLAADAPLNAMVLLLGTFL